MRWIILILAGFALFYFFRNGRRNSDPLNRKCAAEICSLLVEKDDVEIEGIIEIFQRNARYQSQALHVCSMVPPLLIRAGYPRQQSIGYFALLKAAASVLPK